MSSSSFTDKTNKGSKANKLFAALAAVVVLGVGYGLVNTRAAGPFATLEAASVNPTSPAQLVTDSSLPGGKALQFGPTVTLPPPPEPPTTGGKPTSANTGVPAGTKLTIVNGTQIFSKDNEVISGLDIRGDVEIRAKNVTLKNSIVRGKTPPCTAGSTHNEAVIWVREDYNASATIQDVEVYPTAATTLNGNTFTPIPSPCLDGIWAVNSTLLRIHLHGANDGIKADDNVTIRDSYIHDLVFFKNDPNQGVDGGDGTHNDGIQTYQGNQNINIVHNNIALTSQDNATYQLTQDWGGRSTNIRIEDNWLDGGGCTLNLSHKGGPTPMTGIYVLNNRFGRNSGYKDCPILLSTKTTLSQNSGNVWEDTGKPIVAPQVHD